MREADSSCRRRSQQKALSLNLWRNETIRSSRERKASEEDQESLSQTRPRGHPDKEPRTRRRKTNSELEKLTKPSATPKRAAYDQYGHVPSMPTHSCSGHDGGFHDPFDIFREVFGRREASLGLVWREPARSRWAGRGSDLRYDMESFKEAVLDLKKISVRLETCETCRGSGAEAGSSQRTCSTCGGKGQVISRAGLFIPARACPRCEGVGRQWKSPATPALAPKERTSRSR